MIEAILFDLDDTLLENKIDSFLPQYFALLSEHAERFLERGRFLQELLYCTRAMMANTDPARLNREVFWSCFQQRTGLDSSEMELFFEHFYREHFPQLASATKARPVAAKLVRACFDLGLKVAVATNPVFPATAVNERLAWAGVAVTDFAYDLVTTYANMHACKPHRAYYVEILEKIDCPPQKALMVGDNWDHDIIPAAELGCQTYWITQDGRVPSEEGIASDFGSLEKLYNLVQSGRLEELPSSI